jgi:outer membrane autotransporter protein
MCSAYNSLAASSTDSSFEIIGGKKGDSSVGDISFPSLNDSLLPTVPNSVAKKLKLQIRKNTMSGAPLSRRSALSSIGGGGFFFDVPFVDDEVIKQVIATKPPLSQFAPKPTPDGIIAAPRKPTIVLKPRVGAKHQLPSIAELQSVLRASQNSSRQGRQLIRQGTYENSLSERIEPQYSDGKPKTKLEIVEEEEYLIASDIQTRQEVDKLIELAILEEKEDMAVQVISYEMPSVNKTLASNLTNINFDIGMRMDNLTISTPSLGLPISGIASGDSLYKHGAWGHATMSTSRQKETAHIDAFKTKGRGMIFGYDIQTENDNTYGLAYGFNNTKLKFTLGDSKEKIKHHVVSLYSNQILGSNWSMPFSICYGKAFIKTHRDFVWDGKQVTGKTKANTWNIKTGLVYDYSIPKYSLTLTPSAHLIYERVAINGFVENGTSISKSKSWLVSNILGLSIQRPVAIGNNQLIPELHYGFKSKLKGKASKTALSSLETGDIIANTTNKVGSKAHNIGTSLTLSQSSGWSYAAGHQYTKTTDKYSSHTGYIKIRIKL